MTTKPKSEKQKLIIVGVLGVGLLIAVVCQPSPEQNTQTTTVVATQVKHESNSPQMPLIATSTAAGQRSLPLQLEELDVEAVAAVNPFMRLKPKTDLDPKLDASDDPSSDAGEAINSSEIAPVPEVSLSAKYTGRRGSMELLGEEIVHQAEPVRDNGRVIRINRGEIRLTKPQP